MLCELEISNVALIESQHISFGRGLNVLSGETGTGKSVVLQSIQLLIGGKPKSPLVRRGASQAEVRGVFDFTGLSDDVLSGLPELRRETPSADAENEIVIARIISREGRSKVFLNGRLSSVSVLEELGSRLVNVCSQHQHVKLLDPRFHRDVLDQFAGSESLREQVAEAFAAWQEALDRLTAGERALEDCERRSAELQEIVSELGPVKPRRGMRQDLEREVARLSSSEAILGHGAQALQCLEVEDGVLGRLGVAVKEVEEIAKLDGSARPIAELLRAARVHLIEGARTLSSFMGGIDIDNARVESLRESLAEIARLERKYRLKDGELEDLLQRASEEMRGLQAGASLREFRRIVEQTEKRLMALCGELTRIRKEKSAMLSSKVQEGLAEVGMLHASFPVRVSERAPCADGSDEVQFLFSANKGVPAEDLRRIASGGELSRVLLVLKEVLSDRTGVNVLVFDEVDSGISGGVARAVGLKLKRLSRSSQVICVTHIPQVASLADHHLLVEKPEGDRALTIIRELDDDQKIEEIARMLAGYKITAAARESARELLSSKNEQ